MEEFLWIPSSNINFYLGVDGISLFFVILTTLLVPLCILASWESIKIYVKEYMIAFLLMETLLIIVFTILDIVLFYIFFESVLIPMFLIVGIWGSRERKVRAAYMLFSIYFSRFSTYVISYLIDVRYSRYNRLPNIANC